jgi:carbon storage regulator
MLVVTRHSGQSIVIGEDIEVIILEVDHSQVRVGIKAPRSVRVLRSELVERGRDHAAAGRFAASADKPQAA